MVSGYWRERLALPVSLYCSICFLILKTLHLQKRSRLMEKTKNRIIIENPPKKVLDFVMKVQKEKEEARKHLLEKKEHTFSIQM